MGFKAKNFLRAISYALTVRINPKRKGKPPIFATINYPLSDLFCPKCCTFLAEYLSHASSRESSTYSHPSPHPKNPSFVVQEYSAM
jgi:hypothetical protein